MLHKTITVQITIEFVTKDTFLQSAFCLLVSPLGLQQIFP